VSPVPGRFGAAGVRADRTYGQPRLPGAGRERGRADRTGLLTVLVVRADRTYLVAGLVAPAVLQRVATDLAGAADDQHHADLTKRYGRTLAVDGVDLDVREGDRYGLLGPNGSGKTTLVRMLLGLVFATSGEIEVLGRPVPKRVRRCCRDRRAGRGPGAYPHLSGRRNLALLDAAGPGGGRRTGGPGRRGAGAGRARRHRPRPVRAYSLGMRQRLGLAARCCAGPGC
jgi:hypothetical protein